MLRPMPQKRQVLDCQRFFSASDYRAMGRGYRSRSQKDKWIVKLDEQSGRLNFYRSKRGYCIYQMQLRPLADGGAMAMRLVVNRDQSQHYCWSDEDEVRMCNYLIDLLLLKRRSDFPLPLDGPKAGHGLHDPRPEELPRPDNYTDILLEIRQQSQHARLRCACSSTARDSGVDRQCREL